MSAKKTELVRGTLDLLVLRVCAAEVLHGHAIAKKIHVLSEECLLVEEGSLYPALHRLERKGFLKARWGLSENNRRARYYALSARGRRQLREELENWERVSAAVSSVLDAAEGAS